VAHEVLSFVATCLIYFLPTYTRITPHPTPNTHALMHWQVVGRVDGSEVQLPFTDAGKAVNSSSEATGLDINGLSSEEAASKVGGLAKHHLCCACVMMAVHISMNGYRHAMLVLVLSSCYDLNVFCGVAHPPPPPACPCRSFPGWQTRVWGPSKSTTS
jgi:hypothetical protein